MSKSYLNTVEDFKKLPLKVQEEIFNHLGGYSEVCVSYENKIYSFLNGACIKSSYAPDHKVWFFAKKDLIIEYPAQIAQVEKKWYEETKDFDFSQL